MLLTIAISTSDRADFLWLFSFTTEKQVYESLVVLFTSRSPTHSVQAIPGTAAGVRF